MEGADVFAVKGGRNPNYYLIDSSCNKIADTGFSKLEYIIHEPFFLITTAEGKFGLLDAKGNEAVPAKYDTVDILSPRWQVGVNLSSGKPINYKSDEDVIGQADFYFDGNLAGTLENSDVRSIKEAWGSYVSIIDRQGKIVWYNSAMEKSPFTEPDSWHKEYTTKSEDGITVYYHNGTGQKAFMPGCTLTAEEVVFPYLYENMVAYDLQGNELFTLPYTLIYNSAPFNFDDGLCLAQLRDDVADKSQYIIFDDKGNIVMEPSAFFASMELDPVLAGEGYVRVQKEWDLYGYADFSGNEVGEFLINAEDENFLSVYNETDDTVTMYGPNGQIGEKYAYVSDRSSRAFAAETANDEKGAMNPFGETIIPFSSDILKIVFNDAGTAAAVKYDGGKYVIYNFAPAN